MRRTDCGSDCVGPDCEGCQNFKPLSSHAVLCEVREYFQNLRFNDKHHLGLGNIRLTLAQQAEILDIIKEHFA